ncbi:DHHA1 domain protein [Candidatus Methanoplasma termitum]|uniref:DHHA1 domain protein n=1 Tax=Candidatus Methanoplasma termitum TaxID=1577791 RepID=A0A0A7LAM6_9ARCH|nr:DHH family phosphoesterase [Candidatus Methanoplasma termitum]AIZ56094.1 DHHA1 domain protein [Candidatus Methanoplasma termitum]MCL2333776.1 DHH family phosphoesterase [Candidatus Methanoplasma sp.]
MGNRSEKMGADGVYCNRLINDLERAAGALTSAKDVLVVTHIDADGIASGGIASITLDRLGKGYRILFEKKISEDTIALINGSSEDIVWICDLGSAYLSEFKRPGIIVTDHHIPDPKWKSRQTTIDGFERMYHLNPHTYGVSGSYEVCGAGMTYLLSKTADPRNTDLAYLAVIGAIGDIQDGRESKLIGYNKAILDEAVSAGDVVVEEDIRYFGRDYRPLVQFLQYSSDPPIPGISENGHGCNAFFSDLNIPLKRGNVQRTWRDLSPEERRSASDRLLSLAGDDETRKRLFGEIYTLSRYSNCPGLRDAKEFATVLNSCGRYDDAVTGLRICRGDLTALEDAEKNRSDHRKHISTAISYIKENRLLRERRFVQYFDAGSDVRETVVGIVAGMLLNSGEANKGLPIFAFADAEDGTKVSARASRILTDRGLDLSFIMKTASEMVGGYGGGHKVAAGATIPAGKEEEFLDIVEDLVSSQII